MKLSNVKWGKLSSCENLISKCEIVNGENSHWELSNSKCENCIIREYIERWQKASSLKFEWGKLNVKCVMGKFSLEILKFKFRNYKSEFSLGIVKCQMGKFVIICKILICEIVILKFRNYKSKILIENCHFIMRNCNPRTIYWEMTKSVISQILMRKIEWKLQGKERKLNCQIWDIGNWAVENCVKSVMRNSYWENLFSYVKLSFSNSEIIRAKFSYE